MKTCCRYCPNPATRRGLCDDCRVVMAAQPPQKRRTVTASRRAEHPVSNKPAWRRLAKAFLADPANAYCARCLLKGRKRPATQVDHILPARQFPHLIFDLDNLQPLDGKCHSVKSGHERAGLTHDYLRQRTYRLEARR